MWKFVLCLQLCIIWLLISIIFSKRTFLKKYSSIVFAGLSVLMWVFLHQEWVSTMNWDAQVSSVIGSHIIFRLDSLGFIFSFPLFVVGAAVFLFSKSYFSESNQLPVLHLLVLFMLMMFGLLCADDFFLFFFFWEMTTIISFFLISTPSTKKASLSAWQAVFVTSLGALSLLLGLLILRDITGCSTFSALYFKGSLNLSSPQLLVAMVLLIVAALTKSAQFPFHFWLPGAMAAPTPVSAFLHSATMVKVGLFLLLRLFPVFSAMILWKYLLLVAGASTFLLGAIYLFATRDIKLVAAYSTLSFLGLFVSLCSFGDLNAYVICIRLVISHAFSKAALFILAGYIDLVFGTRDLTRLNALSRSTPQIFSFLGVLIVLLKMGFLPCLNFWWKETLIDWAYQSSYIVLGFVLLVMTIVITGIGRAFLLPFFHISGDKTPMKREDVPFSIYTFCAMCLLVIFSFSWKGKILIWTKLSQTLENLNILDKVFLALKGVSGEKVLGHHHFAFMFGILMIAISLLFLLVNAIRRKTKGSFYYWREETSVMGLFYQIITFIKVSSRNIELFFFHKEKDMLLHIFFCFVCAVLFFEITHIVMINHNHQYLSYFTEWPWQLAHYIGFAIMLLTIGLATNINKKRILSIYIVFFSASLSLLYVQKGGIDVALTALLSDILMLFFLFPWLAKQRNTILITDKVGHFLKVLVALIWAIFTSILYIFIAKGPACSLTSKYIQAFSQLLAHGHNMVNTVIVDFRLWDTVGETLVIFTACIIIYNSCYKGKCNE